MTLLARFRGGVHPRVPKDTAGAASQPAPRPARVVLPLRQHLGAPCQPVVQVGDQVHLGQLIGDSDAPVSAPIHASVSGKVVAVEPRPHPGGRMELAVVIESAPEDQWWPELPPGFGWNLDPQILEPELIRQRVRQAGLVGLGGAGFPTATKLSPREGSPVDVVILNGAECEPVITSDHRLMLEEPEKVILGLRLLLQATGAKRGIIAVEANKTDAAAKLSALVTGDPAISVEVLPVRYPQGAEKMLIWALLHRTVPLGGLPLNVGVVVQNVATAAALATAMAEGQPLVERLVTVSGQVAQPGNWRVRLGTPFAELIKASGDFSGPVAKVIAGGPMMGITQPNLGASVIKTTGSILVMGTETQRTEPSSACIHCGRCVAACPMSLLPAALSHAVEASNWDEAQRLNARACLECGSCSYVCPARRPLVQSIRLAKAELGRKARQARG